MRIPVIAFIILGFLTMQACKGKADRPETVITNSPQNNAGNSTNTSLTTPAPTGGAGQNAQGVWHYTCPSGCEGGGASAAPCPKCGATLAHNQAYHNNTNNTTPTINTTNTTATPIPSPITSSGAGQNAAGVWHYTCPSGCEGGGASATACAKCGATLAHNQAYHN